jgi:hypothetical protein
VGTIEIAMPVRRASIASRGVWMNTPSSAVCYAGW